MNTSLRPMIAVFVFGVILLSSVPFAHAAQSSPRTWYVAATIPQNSAGSSWGDGSNEHKPLSSISAALGRARSGDTIKVAQGIYREDLRVNTARLRIEGAFDADNVPLVTVMAPEKSKGPLLVDSKDTLWLGVAFHASKGAVADLRDFTGSFQHCLFYMGNDFATLNIYGGGPVFEACTFVGHPGPSPAITINKQKATLRPVQFAYCLFRDMDGGVVMLRGEQDVQFTNCVFAHTRHVSMRHTGINANISVVNSVFYLPLSPRLFLQQPTAPRVLVENSVYTPAPHTFMVWDGKDLDKQPEILSVNNRLVSPRFEGGRQVLLNLCIDDTANAALWASLTQLAEKLGLKITLALNTDVLTPEVWKVIAPRNNAGFELVSHGAVHSSVVARDVLRIGWHRPENTSAQLDIDADKNFRISVDGKEIFYRALAEDPSLTLGQLVRTLEEQGVDAELVDLSHGKIPAYLLLPARHQDIFFAHHQPVFVLDTDAYQRWMLAESKTKIEQGFKEYGTRQQKNTVMVTPYAETGPGIESAMDDTGYTISRSHVSDKDFVSPREHLNLYYIPSVSLKTLFERMPVDNVEEMFRVYLDYLKYQGVVMGLYAHGANEMNPQNWGKVFDVLSKEDQVNVVSLADMEKNIRELCTPTGKSTFRCDGDNGLLGGTVSFKPSAQSPLWKAGKPTTWKQNYWGQPLPEGVNPNIGLY